ncbi:type IV pilus twitching motility protein PilT [Candidatus Hydrogenedentota bacterium]
MNFNMDDLFGLVKTNNASDLLVTVGAPPMIRVNGKLQKTEYPILEPEDTKELIYAIMTEEQTARLERDKEFDFSHCGADTSLRFRVNIYFQMKAIAGAFRPIASEIPSVDTLGLPTKTLTQLLKYPQGLILVTGPTGHGKSTTLASMVNLINSEQETHIITIEDPIEYVHTNKKSVIDQRELGEDTLSFATALKYVLRQDPDVILVGEMRDIETIAATMTAAETGHMVFATLHTNDATQTVDRIVDVFPEAQQQQIRFQLSMSLLAVLSQRLIPRSGDPGRIMAYEIMRNNPAVANLIREGKTHQLYSVLETHQRDGMVTLDACIKELYLKGLITFDDAINNMKNPQTIM